MERSRDSIELTYLRLAWLDAASKRQQYGYTNTCMEYASSMNMTRSQRAGKGQPPDGTVKIGLDATNFNELWQPEGGVTVHGSMAAYIKYKLNVEDVTLPVPWVLTEFAHRSNRHIQSASMVST